MIRNRLMILGVALGVDARTSAVDSIKALLPRNMIIW